MVPSFARSILAVAVAVGVGAASGRPAAAQAQVAAVAGQPFGVAEVAVDFPPADAAPTLGSSTFTLSSPDGRACYPAFNRGFLVRVLGAGAPPPRRLNVMFLFRGETPFDVTIGTPTAQTVHVVPRQRNPAAYDRVLRRWWRYYTAVLREQSDDGHYPHLVETYLASMLARRLDLAEPLVERLRDDSPKSESRQTLELLSGAESLRMEVLQNNSLGLSLDAQPASLPLPEPVAWRDVSAAVPAEAEDVIVEPMAMRVPPECFYIRFGQYANYLWLNALLEDYGGDLRSMIASRGVRAGVSQRVQDQLAMEQNLLAELFGPQAIADVAMIGLDTFVREGAAIGAIFEAKNELLGADLHRQRQAALAREKDHGSSLETVQVAGRDVSFLSTPDNRLRSYYVVDGPYHLVTNSRRIVERFLEVGNANGSLGASAEFRHARTRVPTSREDTIFAYFSAAFFENLMSPQYQIELHRRLQAATDLDLVLLAQLAARTEGLPGDTLEQLIDAQLLPPGTGLHPDGGRPVIAGTSVSDSLRGARGHFLPVPDLPVKAVSPAEQERYATQRAYYQTHWRQLDPLLVALKRYALDDSGRERITVDALVSPLDDTKFEWFLSALGEPMQHQLVPPTDNLVLVEASVRGGLLFPGVPAHTLFLGLQDQSPLASHTPDNVLRYLHILRTAPGFLGAWPKPGILDVLPLRLAAMPDAEGFTQSLLGIWRWQGRGFSVLSMGRDILEDVGEQVGFEQLDDPAQIRARIGDLSGAQFADWLHAMGYERARQVSSGNAQFLGILTQQLGVPPASALEVAQHLLDAQLVCPLGGTYERGEEPPANTWRSTAWPAEWRREAPADYVTPPLDWFRGLEARVVRVPDQLLLRAHVDMQRKERESLIDLPWFDMFRQSKR